MFSMDLLIKNNNDDYEYEAIIRYLFLSIY